jgi:tetratricopeptide (TPR) repeat protein
VTSPGPDLGRVVQVRARPSFGTGYLIGPGLALTAAHVVTTASNEASSEITVGVPGEEPAGGDVLWLRKDERVDAALIRIPVSDGGDPGVAPGTRYGSFVTAEPEQRVEAIGFPRLQKSESLRDQEHFVGLLSPATGAVSGHVEFTSTTPLPAPSDAKTPWAGMSGAAVFSAGLLIGVVRRDRRAQFGTRLTATPMAEILADETFRRMVAETTGWEPVCEPVELSGFLESPYVRRDIRSVASLLRADAETVTFHGRAPENDRLDAWCAGPGRCAALIVTGQGGEGKTRLARRFMVRQRARGWTTGFLRPVLTDDTVAEERFGPIARTRGPLLIAVDYAENHPLQVRALVRQALAAQGPVRLLLLARGRGVWAEALDEPDAEARTLLAEAPELPLAPLASDARDWDASFLHAVRDIAAALGTLPGHEAEDWRAVAERIVPPPEETHPRPPSVLGIQMTALTLLLQRATPVDGVESGEPVERTLLRHEEAYWTRSARRSGLRGLDRATLRSAVAALRLVVVADRDEAVRLIGALGIGDTDRGRIVARWLHELYPPGTGLYLSAVQPDRLAEFLLVEACAEEHDLLTRIVSGVADHGEPHHLGDGFRQMTALREAVRVARSQAHLGNPVRPLLDQIERTASLPVVSDETLAWAVSNVATLPAAGRKQDVEELADGSFRITGVLDNASAALQVAGYRRGAHPLVARTPREQGFVHMMHSLTLSQLGRTDEALEVCARAVDSFRRAPGSEATLAMELRRLAGLLLARGRDAEAIEALRETVELCEPLNPADTAHTLPPALDELIMVLIRTGRTAQARPYALRETELLRRLVTGPERHPPASYVRALGRYAEILADENAFAEALACCSRAEQFIAGLPPATVDELTGDRALLADVRARLLSDSGDSAGAATAWLEGAALWQRLDGRHGDDHPIVRTVINLNNAAVQNAELGNETTALVLIREATELALSERGQPVRHKRPELYEKVHATYVGYLVNGGRMEDALREAESLCARPAPSTTPLPPSFAQSLYQAAQALAEEGRLAESTRASRLAVETLRALAPPAHDRDLSALFAATLVVHSANLAETGEGTEGAETAAQAATIWRRLSAGHPGVRINLAYALANQAECLRLQDRNADAARAFAEAARTLRELPASLQHRQMLAHMLGGQANCLFEAGHYEAAAEARAEERQIRHELWKADPSAGSELVRAQVELAAALERLDHRLPDAIDAAELALDIMRTVYGPRPDQSGRPEVTRALMILGMALLKSNRPTAAVAPFVNAMAMALNAGDMDQAAACRSAIGIARAIDPDGVAAEWRRLFGTAMPTEDEA